MPRFEREKKKAKKEGRKEGREGGVEEKARYGDREILKSTRRGEGGEERIAIVASAIFYPPFIPSTRVWHGARWRRTVYRGWAPRRKKKKKKKERKTGSG